MSDLLLIPITYDRSFAFDDAGSLKWNPNLNRNTVIDHLKSFDWVQRTPTRMEYYINRHNLPYTYGTGEFARTYMPQPSNEFIDGAWAAAENAAGCKFDVCFLNRYTNERQHLGWHADDSPEMDDARPIAIVTFGAERPADFAVNEDLKLFKRVILENGSICLMHAGMQDTHKHRIPKAGFKCEDRVSLTFRGLAK